MNYSTHTVFFIVLHILRFIGMGEQMEWKREVRSVRWFRESNEKSGKRKIRDKQEGKNGKSGELWEK